ncbi:hypothetical protein, partial [Escherichia coli]|uniref:hypothetical protein n=1 Tax=Escherichia coli TaxID=562 RepID=UPI0021174FD3
PHTSPPPPRPPLSEAYPRVVLTFSIPLDPYQDFSRVIHVVDKKSGKVDGARELSDKIKELRLSHHEPKREFIVTNCKEVKSH